MDVDNTTCKFDEKHVDLMANLYRESVLRNHPPAIARHLFTYDEYPFVANKELALKVLKKIYGKTYDSSYRLSYKKKRNRLTGRIAVQKLQASLVLYVKPSAFLNFEHCSLSQGIHWDHQSGSGHVSMEKSPANIDSVVSVTYK